MQAKKDPTLRSLESRLRNARYLGELAKFRLAPFGTIFVMLKVRYHSNKLCSCCKASSSGMLHTCCISADHCLYSNLFAVQSLLDDFTHHNVDTACALLETAGRFLYRLPDTHTRMANMAEVSLCRLFDACAAA